MQFYVLEMREALDRCFTSTRLQIKYPFKDASQSRHGPLISISEMNHVALFQADLESPSAFSSELTL